MSEWCSLGRNLISGNHVDTGFRPQQTPRTTGQFQIRPALRRRNAGTNLNTG